MDKKEEQDKRVLPKRKPCGCGKKLASNTKYSEVKTEKNINLQKFI
jgi:hypothetical protein